MGFSLANMFELIVWFCAVVQNDSKECSFTYTEYVCLSLQSISRLQFQRICSIMISNKRGLSAGQEDEMQQLNELKPQKVYHFFEEISAIPRGSGNTEEIAAYCLRFAEERGLRAVKDRGRNVIIYADGTPGYENSAPFILQGHMDMVCEKTADCNKDMAKEGLDLRTDGKFVWAEGTTLGGDDGIALAFIFALLDSDDIPHPPIEAIITRDEETGMFGAEELDESLIHGKTLLNIDSEEEGILTVSCAGGVDISFSIPVAAAQKSTGDFWEIAVSGLRGGHSGADIGKNRANALKTLGAMLRSISEQVPFSICSAAGGNKPNVIPQLATAVIHADSDGADTLRACVESFGKQFAAEYGETDPDAVCSIRPATAAARICDAESTAKIITFLADAPNGVTAMSETMPGIVQTSLNLGVFRLEKDHIEGTFLIRSNLTEERDDLLKTTEAFISRLGGDATVGGAYPPWEYRKDSPLRELMTEVFREQYGKEPVISAIHAGLECAIFSNKLKDADMISIGPDIHDIHTPDERMDVASVARTWEFVKEILRRSR